MEVEIKRTMERDEIANLKMLSGADCANFCFNIPSNFLRVHL